VSIPHGDFLFAEVKLTSQGLKTARYKLTNGGSVVDVDNSTHIRLVEDQNNLPERFKVMAPMGAVKVISGNIPDENIQETNASDYLATRKRYLGH